MKWQEAEKRAWLTQQTIKRSYQQEVVTKIQALKSEFEVVQYGALAMDTARYPLFLIHSKPFVSANETVLITGGVHGYETSGVHGALAFLERTNHVQMNLVCAPCISPWAYETINRWNPHAIDPNRSFYENSPAEECRLLLEAMAAHKIRPHVHIDLHETTDTDNTVFRPALAARDGVEPDLSEIPDGFYLVANTENPQIEFQKAIIDAVRPITHIAKPDADGKIIGEPLLAEGVIAYPLKKLFLCAGFSDAAYTTTTEVYPDSPKATPEICINAQVAAIQGALDFFKD
jgi:hypothetical protein